MIFRAIIIWLGLVTTALAQVPMTGAGLGTPTVASSVAFITPLLVLGSNTVAPATNSTTYDGMSGAENNATWSSTLGFRATPIPIPGTFKGLEVNVPSITAFASGTDTISLNASASTGSSPSCVLNSTTVNACSDHNTNTMHVAAGATVAVKSVSSSASYTNGTPAPWQVSTAFLGDNANEGMVLGSSNYSNLSAVALSYFFTNLNATEASASIIMPAAGTLDTLYIALSAAPGASSGYVFTVYKNGQATTVVAGDGSSTCWGASSTACSDTAGCTASTACTHSVSVVQGDSISIQGCPSTASNTLSCTNMSGCVGACSAPTARVATFGLRWLPTTNKQAVVIGGVSGPAVTANAVNYTLPSGFAGAAAATTNLLNVVPYTSTVQTYSQLTVGYCWTGTSAANSGKTIAMQASSGSPTISASIAASISAACPSAGSQFPFVSSTGSYATAGPTVDASTMNMVHTEGTANGVAYTQYKSSMIVVTQ